MLTGKQIMPIQFQFSLLLCLVTLVAGCSDSSTNVNSKPDSESQKPKKTNSSGTPKRDKTSTGNLQIVAETPSKMNGEEISQGVTKPTAGKFDWPHWRGPNGNNHSSEVGLIHTFPESGPKILWRKPLGSGFSGLTVSGGRVFTLFGDSGRENIICFNANTGREIWKIDNDADFKEGRSFGPRSTPCVEGDKVYAVGASGKLHCLEAATGKTVWSFNIYEKYSMRVHFEGLSCSPQIDGKKLIVAAGTAVFAFDKTDGKLIWRALKEKMNHSTPVFATVDDRKQLVVLTGNNLVSLDPASGKELWKYPQRGANCVTPIVGPENQIFTAAAYGFGSQMVKIANGTATQVYKNNTLSTHHATAMLYKGNLYGFHDRPGIFKCVEFATGKEKWSSRSPGKGKLIIADGQMIIITEYGGLVLAKPSPNSYQETAKARVVKGTCYTAPTLANGKLYVRSDKEMVCIDFRK
jgi:outer membrane protein assembly factor BamB